MYQLDRKGFRHPTHRKNQFLTRHQGHQGQQGHQGNQGQQGQLYNSTQTIAIGHVWKHKVKKEKYESEKGRNTKVKK